MEMSKKLETRMDALNETIQGFLVCWDFTLFVYASPVLKCHAAPFFKQTHPKGLVNLDSPLLGRLLLFLLRERRLHLLLTPHDQRLRTQRTR